MHPRIHGDAVRAPQPPAFDRAELMLPDPADVLVAIAGDEVGAGLEGVGPGEGHACGIAGWPSNAETPVSREAAGMRRRQASHIAEFEKWCREVRKTAARHLDRMEKGELRVGVAHLGGPMYDTTLEAMEQHRQTIAELDALQEKMKADRAGDENAPRG